MKIELTIISNLGLSAGGRETWLNNFLYGLKKYSKGKKINIDIHSLSLVDNNLLKNHKDIVRNIEYKGKFWRFPIFVIFIMKYLYRNLFKKKEVDKYIAIGGFDEMVALLLGNFIYSKKEQRIIWLRSIYTKEKGERYPKILLKIILFIEVFLLKNFFGQIIANGQDTASFYKKFNLNVEVIPNAVFIENWEIAHNSINQSKLNIAFIGRLTNIKGFNYFIDSIVEINKISSNFIFHIIGEGPNQDIISNIDNIIYYGAVSNDKLPILLKDIDVCVALTLYDKTIGGAGISNALIEQMAAHKVIICWDNQIFRQILSENSGYFVEQRNIKKLVNTYIEIFDNKNKASEVSNQSYKIALNYSIKMHIEKFLKVVK